MPIRRDIRKSRQIKYIPKKKKKKTPPKTNNWNIGNAKCNIIRSLVEDR